MDDMLFQMKDDCRKNLIKYTLLAFSFVPKADNMKILDMGCGSGVATLELAAAYNATVYAVDSDSLCTSYLDKKRSRSLAVPTGCMY